MNFERAVSIVLDIEGGAKISNRSKKDDPGGLTKYGISLRNFPHLGEAGIRNLTETDAKNIYHAHYWMGASCFKFPEPLRLAVFDASVHHWKDDAYKFVQRGLNRLGNRLEDDGILGPLTLQALSKADPGKLLDEMHVERLNYMRSLSNYKANARGWEKRVMRVSRESGQQHGA